MSKVPVAHNGASPGPGTPNLLGRKALLNSFPGVMAGVMTEP